jgi:hypothetical protein
MVWALLPTYIGSTASSLGAIDNDECAKQDIGDCGEEQGHPVVRCTRSCLRTSMEPMTMIKKKWWVRHDFTTHGRRYSGMVIGLAITITLMMLIKRRVKAEEEAALGAALRAAQPQVTVRAGASASQSQRIHLYQKGKSSYVGELQAQS